MSDAATPATPQIPTVYFIDDSATMREVVKIAFRKENMNVVACHSAASALEQFSQNRPDVVISDVIMPDKDGYEVCRYVKEHPEFGATPVILMSGVVNRQVAEKAMFVKADELIRKPFQPQELIARVKTLLHPKFAGSEMRAASTEVSATASRVLGSLFAPATGAVATLPAPAPAASSPTPRTVVPAAPRPPGATMPAPANAAPPAPLSPEIMKLRAEIRRLELLIRKLQSELEGERQYTAELESQLRVQQETP